MDPFAVTAPCFFPGLRFQFFEAVGAFLELADPLQGRFVGVNQQQALVSIQGQGGVGRYPEYAFVFGVDEGNLEGAGKNGDMGCRAASEENDSFHILSREFQEFRGKEFVREDNLAAIVSHLVFVHPQVSQDAMTQVPDVQDFLLHPGIGAVGEDGDITVGHMFNGFTGTAPFGDHSLHGA